MLEALSELVLKFEARHRLEDLAPFLHWGADLRRFQARTEILRQLVTLDWFYVLHVAFHVIKSVFHVFFFARPLFFQDRLLLLQQILIHQLLYAVLFNLLVNSFPILVILLLSYNFFFAFLYLVRLNMMS